MELLFVIKILQQRYDVHISVGLNEWMLYKEREMFGRIYAFAAVKRLRNYVEKDILS